MLARGSRMAPAVMMADYPARVAAHTRDRDAAARRSLVIARLRIATFLPGLVLLLWGLTRVSAALVIPGGLLLLVFAALVVWHARVDERVAWHDALRAVNQRAIARNERHWDALPPADPPGEIDLPHHPYAHDLDVFGRASLFQWLGPAATALGGRTLAAWLLAPAAPADVEARQAAVAELAPAIDWRAEFGAHGELAGAAGQPEIVRFLQWAEGPGLLGRRAGWVRAGAYVIAPAIWLLLGLQLAGYLDAALWLVPLLAGLVLSYGLTGVIQESFTRAGGGQRALSRYAALLGHVEARSVTASRLAALRDRLGAGGVPASRCMRRLNRILGFSELRAGAAIFHFFIQGLTLWDLHVLLALERWRTGTGIRVRGWLEALAELDALTALAGVRHDHPDWCFPSFATDPLVGAEALGHPLIPEGRRVANDVEIGPPGTLLLVTGSNMSGKSTLLRAVGLNVILAQAGGCVCARRLELMPADLQTSMRVQDSLELGLSYFMAALARLKGVVDAAEHPREGRVMLYLLDEILQGTNSAERGIAVRAIARHLLDAGAIGAMTTHDLNLAAEEPLDRSARLVHFTETVDERGEMRFDYTLKPGLATSRNALRLMKLIGIDS